MRCFFQGFLLVVVGASPIFSIFPTVFDLIHRRAINITQELRHQLSKNDSHFVNFSNEIKDIFQQDHPTKPDEDQSDTPTHEIRDLNQRNPFDLSSLASQLEEYEIINLTSLFPQQIIPGSEMISHIVSGMIRGAQKNGGAPKRRLGTYEHRNRLLGAGGGPGGFVLGRMGLLNNVLGGLSPLGFDPPPQHTDKLPHMGPGPGGPPQLAGGPPQPPGPAGGPPQPPAHKLMGKYNPNESEDRIIETIDSCILLDAEILGINFLVVRAQDIWHCQELCKKNPRCEFVTYRQDERLCYHYSEANSLTPRVASITAPKNCETEGASVDEVAPVTPVTPVAEVGLSGQQFGGVPMMGLGSLLGGTSMTSALATASSVMTTGSQLMQALPLKELAQAGMQLSESGYLRNRGMTRSGPSIGGGRRDKSSMAPPPGIGSPVVNCRTQGLTCCVPRQAVPDWQTKPPYLNNYDIPSCRSIYVSTTDQMCATSSYEGEDDQERCGLSLTELNSDLRLFRHVLTIPNKNINNAICECRDDQNHTGSARWEYSMVAVDEIRNKLNETEATAQKLVRGANAAVALTQILGGGGGGLGGGGGGFSGGGGGFGGGAGPAGPVQNAGTAMAAFGNAMNMMGSLGSMVKNYG